MLKKIENILIEVRFRPCLFVLLLLSFWKS
jgi:hypothetical protein